MQSPMQLEFGVKLFEEHHDQRRIFRAGNKADSTMPEGS